MENVPEIVTCIADPAVATQTFIAPFKPSRMTWIKPSFSWMTHRSGWAAKPRQERILSIRITRAGFEEALSQAVLSHYDPSLYGNYNQWQTRKNKSYTYLMGSRT
jgi:hypothetical protein